MALPIRNQLIYWGLAFAVFLWLLWTMGSVMLPYVVGAALAYFLDPVVDRLETLGLGRVAATALITLGSVLVLVLLVLAVIPTLIQQTYALINEAPEMSRRMQAFLIEKFPELSDSTSVMRQTLSDIGTAVQSKGAVLAQGLVSSAMSLISALIFLIVTPVVAFYLLVDWDHMVARLDTMLPRDHAPVIRRLAGEIDETLSSFVRGQFSVCAIMGIYYSIGLMLAGLQFGLVVGAFAGIVTFIPYVGALLGCILAIGLALFQYWGEWTHVIIITAVFMTGQMAEGNVITPKLVGKSVGLHPVVLMLALSVFGSLFGFVGMLVAVPVAAALGVLIRFGIAQYQSSLLYIGRAGRIPEDEDQA
jgi:predicted PurR-regulated permease PerM